MQIPHLEMAGWGSGQMNWLYGKQLGGMARFERPLGNPLLRQLKVIAR